MKPCVQNLVAVFACVAMSCFAMAETRVNVSSQPSGATVVIDGIDRGTTPITLFNPEPGRHHLKFRLSGYCTRDRFFNTDEGSLIERNEVLVEEKGLLLLKTDPAGCDIQIDGIPAGRTPRLVTDLSTKDAHAVRFRKAGYQDRTVSVKFEGRTPLVREEKLEPAFGTLDVVSDPAGAEVTVNGVVRGKAPLRVSDVPKGQAVVKFRLEGFEEEIREQTVRAGEVLSLPVALKALPAVTGRLEIRSSPPGAQVVLDGRPLGVTKAADAAAEFSEVFAVEDLAEGEHLLVLKKDGYADKVTHPQIQVAKTAMYHKQRLTRIFDPDVELLTTRGDARGVLVSDNPVEVVVEVSPGITRSFPRNEIRKITYLRSAP